MGHGPIREADNAVAGKAMPGRYPDEAIPRQAAERQQKQAAPANQIHMRIRHMRQTIHAKSRPPK